jgi:hypothetical protein
MERVEEGAGVFVMPRSDSAVDLSVADHAIDGVALTTDVPVPADFVLAI